MSTGEFRLPNYGSRVRAFLPSRKFVRLAHLRELRGSEQVAAICYRVRGTVIEFLLVQTRGERWIFPKGSAEPGLTHAQAAALEAFEEAGVHGRMEETAFTRYVRRKRANNGDSTSVELTVHAHLCEVLWLDPRKNGAGIPLGFLPRRPSGVCGTVAPPSTVLSWPR